jgi:hypothetical protein
MLRPILIAAVVAAVAPLTGCVVRTSPLVTAEPAPVVVEDYRPMYYGSHIVYYDTYDARPYYVVRGRAHYVPRSYVHYNVLVGHYRRSPDAYRRWHSHDRHRHVGPPRRPVPHRHHRHR